jgi:hypothetical protein
MRRRRAEQAKRCGASRCSQVHQAGIIADEYRAAGEAGGDFGQAEGSDEIDRLG